MQGRLNQLVQWSVLCALCASPLSAQSPNLATEDRDMVRVTRHPDGARAIYKRQAGTPGMYCVTYSPRGQRVATNYYIEGKYGQLVGCRIYDSNNKIIYKVSYGYDRNARLIEERMYTNPDGVLVQRVIYKYDVDGVRSKPLIVSLNRSGNQPQIAPTMGEDVNAMNQQGRKK